MFVHDGYHIHLNDGAFNTSEQTRRTLGWSGERIDGRATVPLSPAAHIKENIPTTPAVLGFVVVAATAKLLLGIVPLGEIVSG